VQGRSEPRSKNSGSETLRNQQAISSMGKRLQCVCEAEHFRVTGAKLVAVQLGRGRARPGHPDNRALARPLPTLPRMRGRVGRGRDKPGDDAISSATATISINRPPIDQIQSIDAASRPTRRDRKFAITERTPQLHATSSAIS
jgi:hypothetical protein